MLKIAFFLGGGGGGGREGESMPRLLNSKTTYSIYAQAFKQQNYVYYCEIQ